MYEGYEESSENCISRLYFGLNISINLNKMLINSFVEIFLAFMGRLKRLFTK